MTEAEAKTKWCPMVRAGVYGEGAACAGTVTVNRDPRFDDIALCVGSDCMMWRWQIEYVAERAPRGSQPTPKAAVSSKTEGYCGLAGMPLVFP